MEEDGAERLADEEEPQERREWREQLAVRLDALLAEFAQVHAGMKQRDASWHAAMGWTVGGSELAALMGMNPYSRFHDVVASKVAVLEGLSGWDGGSAACWWGVLFEDVIGLVTEIDLGGRIHGDEICIQAVAGHRNSPDGYIVGRYYRDAGGRERLWTTDLGPAVPATPAALLLEFKCPLSRKPEGSVPAHYRPQVWSGLAVSPVAHRGLFVDAVFRKCGLADLGDTPAYDTAYHARDAGRWGHPVAWGLIGVYAPRLGAPRHVRLGWRRPEWAPGDPCSDGPDADAAQAAWEIHSLYFGLRLRDQAATPDVADLGDMAPALFERALGLINRRRFPVRLGAPRFADGRGAPVGTADALRRAAPEHHWLVGVLPWKLLEVDYVTVERRPGFLDEVRPLIDEVHRAVAEARAAADPAKYLSELRVRGAPPPVLAASEADIQDLFDAIGA